MMDHIDQTLLNAAQGAFPLSEAPFAMLGEAVGLSEKETLRRLQRLREKGFIRFFGPIIATRAIGFRSVLCAFQVEPEKIEDVAKMVSTHPGVSHNYSRDDRVNLWFTLAVPPHQSLQKDFEILVRRTGVERAFFLPSLRTFKLRMVLDVTGEGRPTGSAPAEADAPPRTLTRQEKEILQHLEKGLAITTRPFEAAAKAIDISEADVCSQLQCLLDRGVVRRFAILLNHQRAGFRDNAMVVWRAPEGQVSEWGAYLAALPQASHVYERPSRPGWAYNLYTMLHGQSAGELEEIVRQAVKHLGAGNGWRMLRSQRQFKKQRLQYFTGAFDTWPR